MKITVLRSHATPQIEMWQDENSCGAAGSLDTSVFVRHILHGSGRQATVSIYCSSFLYIDTSVFVRHILHGSGRQATVSIYCSSFLYITHSYVPRYQSNTPPICDHIDSSSKVLKSAPISAFYRGAFTAVHLHRYRSKLTLKTWLISAFLYMPALPPGLSGSLF